MFQKLLTLLTLSISMAYADFSAVYKQEIKDPGETYVWMKEETPPFNDLLLSWDALRPESGSYLFQVRIKVGDWSPWMNYGEWSASSQFSFSENFPDSYAKVFQDIVNTSEGKLATGFEIQVVAKEGASLSNVKNLYVCASQLSQFTQDAETPKESYQISGIEGQSQLILDHPRGKDMCSPTSTSTVINFLLGRKSIDPLNFASKVKDQGFDIYGNWAFNVAEANHLLHGKYSCHIERLNSFQSLLNLLKTGVPQVVSVKGEFTGARMPYKNGHLMVVTGFDAEKQKVHCIDSAFLSNDQTVIAYPLDEFLKAWGARKYLTYVFEKR